MTISPGRWWPVLELEWYFKPDGIQLLCSLSEENPSPPCDARPEPLDIALAIERINDATTLGIRSVRSSWTGLRTFAPDREMVIGFDPRAEGFFWLVGQGGTGIQTAPGAGELDRFPDSGFQSFFSADRPWFESGGPGAREIRLMATFQTELPLVLSTWGCSPTVWRWHPCLSSARWAFGGEDWQRRLESGLGRLPVLGVVPGDRPRLPFLGQPGGVGGRRPSPCGWILTPGCCS